MVVITKLKEHFSDGVTDTAIEEFKNLLSNKSYIENSLFLFDAPKKSLHSAEVLLLEM